MALVALAIGACNMRSGGIANPSANAATAASATQTRRTPEAIPLFARLGLWSPSQAPAHTPSTSGALAIWGTWLKPPSGPLFAPLDTLDPRNAMVYVYRPSTVWEDQELQAPSFFVDGIKVFGVKSGSYTWLELRAGTVRFYAKRPLGIFFIKKVFELPLTVEGGVNYYLRYSEDDPFDYRTENLNADEFMNAGFLQQVPESVALAEMGALKLDHQGIYLSGSKEVAERWAPFQAFPETGKDPESAVPAQEEDTLWRRTKLWVRNLF